MIQEPDLRALADSPWLTTQCSFLMHGECSTRSCLQRGNGGVVKVPVDYTSATCIVKETHLALNWAADQLEETYTIVKGLAAQAKGIREKLNGQ